MNEAPGETLLDESHLVVRLAACACGQRFAFVSCEVVDWSGGEDAQERLGIPIDAQEARALSEAGPGVETALPRVLGPRRFVVRRWPTGGELTTTWDEGPIRVPPHD